MEQRPRAAEALLVPLVAEPWPVAFYYLRAPLQTAAQRRISDRGQLEYAARD
jgi:hypothetical protein